MMSTATPITWLERIQTEPWKSGPTQSFASIW